jgi:FkbM family methyltransferase
MMMKSNQVRAFKALINLRRRKTWGPFVETSELTGFDHAFTVSWSQGGEDIALLSALQCISKGNYIDVGAHHPSRFSVTRHLYQRGWSGINVDANPYLIGAFSESRTRDINLWTAVGANPEYEFTIFVEPAISTVNDEWKNKFLQENQTIKEVIKVPGKTLRAILDENFGHHQLDLLAIDAEGADFEVLESLDFSTLPRERFPKYLLLEAAPPVSTALQTPAVKLAIDHGYEPQMVLAMSTLLKFGKF